MKDHPELCPSDAESITIGPPAKVAGGVPAVVSSMRHANGEMGMARAARVLAKVNQQDGFDCPGCAWPDPAHRTLTEFCENGAKAVAAEATLKRCDPDFFRRWSVAEIAEQTDAWMNAQGRLTHPMVLRERATHYEEIAWDEAFAIIAGELRALATPDEAIFYTSGRTSNEAAFLYQLFARRFGTNNLPDCSNMCHESSGVALRETIGVGKGTVQLDDFEVADVILVVGQNPGTNHPRMLTTLEAAARRGATIVSVNPLAEPGTMRFKHPQDVAATFTRGTKLASLHVPVRINGDVAFFQGVAKHVVESGAVDRDFVAQYTDGFEAFEAAIRARSWRELEESSGVSKDEMIAVGRLVAQARGIIACWAMGLTQHKNAVANIQEVVNVLLLRGSIGRPGAGVCPVRGHSNVQGDRTMGIWEKMDEAFLDRLGRAFAFTPPKKHGVDTVDAIRAMREGRAKVFFAMGGNFLSATPDTEATARALEACMLTAQVSTKLNRSHVVTGKRALILPCLGRTERDVKASGEQVVSVENSMGIVHASRGMLLPASEALLSEVAIVCELARAVFGDDEAGRAGVPWEAFADDYDRIRDAIARVVPGFDAFNERVREPGGFALPNAARERVFNTATKRARFTVHAPPRHELRPGELLMMTVRSHDQYNTTVYGLDDRYRGVHGGRRVVFMNADDIAERALADGDVVDLVSRFGESERRAPSFRVVRYDIPRSCVATYFPEANVLVALDSVADKSNTPASKSIVVRVERAASPD